jgi:hypothetical protein
MKAILNRQCGHRDCTSSMTGNGERITFGRGSLSQDGFWEIPCLKCAQQFNASREAVIDQTRNNLQSQGQKPEMIERYLSETRWLHNEAWPSELDVERDSVNVGAVEGQLVGASE